MDAIFSQMKVGNCLPGDECTDAWDVSVRLAALERSFDGRNGGWRGRVKRVVSRISESEIDEGLGSQSRMSFNGSECCPDGVGAPGLGGNESVRL